jgi:predicted nucleic acid-binding protein
LTLVDSNVLIDVLIGDPVWLEWSMSRLSECGANSPLFVNDIIFAEIAVTYATVGQVEAALNSLAVERMPFTTNSLFLAATAFQAYRRNSGAKTNVLPDFFIGAQALDQGWAILTRDVSRYRTYFPKVRLIAP